ncbi:MAG TPA: TetR family transcriptional regulator [Actinobacteria bacterium]|jgi:AcrR family transcriptional regulator|nr:TetR family transcriptional regulator [Actinomycetota bacterium]HCP61121.1 TetR family transcriptional regulator [Actinomycetota bacterium]
MSEATIAPVEDRVERAPGRPRNADCDTAILAATAELLGECGYGRLSIEGVAARAGVGKSTIYRRWPSKVPLVIDAVACLHETAVPAEDEDTRQALVMSLSRFIHLLSESPAGPVLFGLIAELPRNPDLARAVREELLSKRRSRVFAILQRGIERGELREDTDLELTADLLAGPVFVRLMITGGPTPPDLAERVVDQVLAGLRRT